MIWIEPSMVSGERIFWEWVYSHSQLVLSILQMVGLLMMILVLIGEKGDERLD